MAATTTRLSMKEEKEKNRRLEIAEKEKFIGEVQSFPALWDRSKLEYRLKDVVDDGWTEVATRMQWPSK